PYTTLFRSAVQHDDLGRAGPPVAELCAAATPRHGGLDDVAVAPLRGRRHDVGQRRQDLRRAGTEGAAQGVGHHLALQLQLVRVGHVAVVETGVRRGRHPVGARLQHRRDAAAHDALLALQLHAHELARQGARDEHHLARGEARQGHAAVDHPLDPQRPDSEHPRSLAAVPGAHLSLFYTAAMKRSLQEYVELVVFGLVALLVGTGLLWLVGWVLSIGGVALKWVAGLLW